jgi:hypothetical protein
LKWRKEGLSHLGVCLLATFLFSFPVLLIWVKFGHLYLLHAMESSWGPLARFYAGPDSDYFTFWKGLYRAMGLAVFPCLAILVVALVALVKHHRGWPRMLPGIALLGYLAICSLSRNSDVRFLMPVMIGLPFAAASLVSTRKGWQVNGPLVAVVAFVLVLACVPMVQRPDVRKFRNLPRLLQTLEDAKARNILIATDSPTFNIESFLLSKEILGKSHAALTIGTLAYDYMHSIDLEYSLKRVDGADAVIFEKPFPKDPDFTNNRVQEYYGRAIGNKRLFPQSEVPDLEILISSNLTPK